MMQPLRYRIQMHKTESSVTTENMSQKQTELECVKVIDADRSRIVKKPFGKLDSVDEGALAAFLQCAWPAPGDWHRLPGSTLALRAIPNIRETGTTCFELRCDDNPGELRRYEFDPSTSFLTCWTNRQADHPEITCKHNIPADPELFALMVAAFVHVDRDSRNPNNIPRRKTNTPNQDMRAESPAVGPLPSAIANIVDRVAHQWFSSATYKWNTVKRVLIALAGSVTFFGTFSAYIALDPDSKYEWLRMLSSGEDIIPGLLPLILVIVAVWFAWLNSYKNMGHGAIRLYLGGFLLPYLVWALISAMPGMDDSSEVTKQAEGLGEDTGRDAAQ